MSNSFSVADAVEGGYITGLKTAAILPRLEIDEFVLDQDVLNLFIIALERLQSKDYRHPWSWFQISGIHGQPSAPWDNVEGGKPGSQRSHYAGYCSHSSITFPTWHRPYVAMMEQALYAEMTAVASKYTDDASRKKYQHACTRFRFPYWDPCIPRQLMNSPLEISAGSQLSNHEFGIPMIVSYPKVFVRRPEAPHILEKIDNPLFQYKFPQAFHYPNNPGYFWDQAGSNTLIDNPSKGGTLRTVRAPDESGRTDDGYFNSYVSSHIHSDVGSSFYRILTGRQRWETFSNDVYDRQAAAEASNGAPVTDHTLEGFHDNLHSMIGQGRLQGGSGHMSSPQYAAFDPIFWLHHCNVDRIAALWQAQRPTNDSSSWWTSKPAGEANRAFQMGDTLKPSDPLVPFRYSERNPGHENFYTSDKIRDWTSLGYTYLVKRIVRNKSTGRNEIATSLLAYGNSNSAEYTTYFNQFYGWLDIPESTYPDLIRQFYPIDLSNVEALTGKYVSQSTIVISNPTTTITPASPSSLDAGVTVKLPSYPGRLGDGPPPSINLVDYGYSSRLLGYSNTLRQWDLHIVAEKFAMKKSYQVFVFLGPFNSETPDDWPTDPYLVGIDGIFCNNPHSGNCSNCETQASSKLCVMDVIPLTHHLVKWIRSKRRCPPYGGDGLILESLEYEQVGEFLRKNLHWRVADMNLCPLQGQCDFVKVQAIDQIVRLPGSYDEEVVYEGSGYRHEAQSRSGGGYERRGARYGSRDVYDERRRYDRGERSEEEKRRGTKCVIL